MPGGARLPAAAVAAVTVKPTHRRRGILTSLAAAEHAAIRERGEAFGLLYASEYPIYGRFGYGPGCRLATWTLDVGRTGFVGDPVSGVELIPADEAAAGIRTVFEAWRPRQAGEIRRRDFHWLDDVGVRRSRGPRGRASSRSIADPPVSRTATRATAARRSGSTASPRATSLDELHALTDEATPRCGGSSPRWTS